MEIEMPDRKICMMNASLDDFQGGWTDILRQLLEYFKCSTKLRVKIYIHEDGEIMAKYRVGIMLPTKLGLSVIMPYGEARTLISAYQIAVVEAVTRIREKKSTYLWGTPFMAIPHGDEGNHCWGTRYVKQKFYPTR